MRPSARATRSAGPLCSTISVAGASATSPRSAATAGGRFAGSRVAASISSIALGPSSRRPTTDRSASSTDSNGTRASPRRLGQGHEPDLGAEDHGERAFGADDQPRPVRVLAAEGVQVVAGDAPHQARSAEAPGERRRGGERGGWTPATTERRDRPVGQRDVERLDGVRRQPVDDRPRTGRVVPDHAAERGATGRRDVGPEGEAVRRRGAIEVVEHHAGPDAGEPRVRVDLDPGEARRVDDQARCPPPVPPGSSPRPAS